MTEIKEATEFYRAEEYHQQVIPVDALFHAGAGDYCVSFGRLDRLLAVDIISQSLSHTGLPGVYDVLL